MEVMYYKCTSVPPHGRHIAEISVTLTHPTPSLAGYHFFRANSKSEIQVWCPKDMDNHSFGFTESHYLCISHKHSTRQKGY